MLERLLNITNLLVSLTAIATLVWWHGFAYTPGHLNDHQVFLHACFAFYILQFIIRGRRTGGLWSHMRLNVPESLLFVLYAIEVVAIPLWGSSPLRVLLGWLGTDSRDYLFLLAIHFWLLLIVGMELSKATARSTVWKLPLPVLLVLSFLVLIAVGASLLMLPEMTAEGHVLSFTDALFTSVSANCVTGLVVVDTATQFTLKGKAVIMTLIQLGGLNIMSFATFFISQAWFRAEESVGDPVTMELLHVDTLRTNRTLRMVGRVLATAVLLEAIGAWAIFNGFTINSGSGSRANATFDAIFLSVSAFNNAGFTTHVSGLMNEGLVCNYVVQGVVAALIIAGGLGFTTLWDLARLRLFLTGTRSARIVGGRIALITSVVLLVGGTVLFFLLETQASLSGKDVTSSIMAAFFQSVTARTAGFNTVDMTFLSGAGTVLIMVLMFIGASSGSTGGGIKTGTASILFLGLLERLGIRSFGAEAPAYFSLLFRKAMTIAGYALATLVCGTTLLVMLEDGKPFIDLLFEEVSALGTVGLSRNITADLSGPGKVIVMITIFIGRVGPLGLAYVLRGTTGKDHGENEGFMIG